MHHGAVAGDTLLYRAASDDDTAGDTSPTVESLYRSYADTVARWAQRLGGPTIDADDVLQQVFIVVQKQLGGLRSASSARAWIFRITQNEVRQARRRERLRRWWTGSAISEDDAPPAPETPHSALEKKQTARDVYSVLDRMPEKYRSILILFQLEGMSGEEIAQLTGLKIGTVWVRLHRARARFLALMDDVKGGGAP